MDDHRRVRGPCLGDGSPGPHRLARPARPGPVWKRDRAFRSVAHMANTVADLRRWGVGLRSYSKPMVDTSGASPLSDLLLNLMASFAQFERSLIAERVRAGMARAKRQGKHVGRPRRHLNGTWTVLRPQVLAGQVSQR